MKDYMIKIGETADGKIIEMPDVFIAFGVMFLLFIMISINQSKQ
tara:strand:- start:125 stop:256 length:132 start_codon:yes stop_codon:yes gene_type:complete